MSDREGELSLEMGRAAQARAIYESDLFQEAFDTVKEHFTIQLLNSQSDQELFRDLCWRCIKAADLFQQFFTHALETGQMAEKELEQIKRNKDRLIGGTADPYGALA